MGKERINKNILYMSELGILIAILLLMAFTPVGYLRIGTMTITFLTVPSSEPSSAAPEPAPSSVPSSA